MLASTNRLITTEAGWSLYQWEKTIRHLGSRPLRIIPLHRKLGLRVGDTLIAIDGHQVSELSLSELWFKLKLAKACELLVEPDGARLKIPLKLRDSI